MTDAERDAKLRREVFRISPRVDELMDIILAERERVRESGRLEWVKGRIFEHINQCSQCSVTATRDCAQLRELYRLRDALADRSANE